MAVRRSERASTDYKGSSRPETVSRLGSEGERSVEKQMWVRWTVAT